MRTIHSTRLRNSVVATVLALALASWAGVVQSQVNMDETVNTAVSGKVTVVDAAAKTITVVGPNDDGGVFWINDKTTIMADGPKKLGFDALKKGQHVAVDADTKDSKSIATYIEIVDAAN